MAINVDELCGCNPRLLTSRTVERNLQDCGICGFSDHCTYPRETALKMVKAATEEEESAEETNLQIIARSSHDFASFHQKTTRKQDRLCREPEQKNLREIAQGSMTFSDYHEKATENDKLPPPPKRHNKNLMDIARQSMAFGDFHEKAQDV